MLGTQKNSSIFFIANYVGLAQLVRAPGLHPGGRIGLRGFKSFIRHQISIPWVAQRLVQWFVAPPMQV